MLSHSCLVAVFTLYLPVHLNITNFRYLKIQLPVSENTTSGSRRITLLLVFAEVFAEGFLVGVGANSGS